MVLSELSSLLIKRDLLFNSNIYVCVYTYDIYEYIYDIDLFFQMCPSLLSARGQACATTTWEYTLYRIVLFRFLVHLLIWIVCFLQLFIILFVCVYVSMSCYACSYRFP